MKQIDPARKAREERPVILGFSTITPPNLRRLGSVLLMVFGVMVLLISVIGQTRATMPAWTIPVKVSDTVGASYGPTLVADSHNTLHMIWHDWIDQVSHPPYVQYAQKPAGGTWSAASYLPGHPYGGSPAMAIDGQDMLHLVFEDSAGNLTYLQRFTNGSWSAQETIPGSEEGITPDIALAADGTVHAVWSFTDPPAGEIRHNFKTGGQWQSPTLVTVRDESAYNGAIAVDPSNGLHLLWSAAGGSDWYAYKPSGGAWGYPAAMPFDIYILNGEQLAVDAAGRLHLSWSEGGGGDPCRVKYVYRDRGHWTAPVRFDDKCAYTTAVSIDPHGRAQVAWNTFASAEIWYTFLTAGGDWYPPTQAGSESWGRLSVTRGGNGGHYIAWDTSSDGNIWFTSIPSPPPLTFTVPISGFSYQASIGGLSFDFPPGAVSEETVISYRGMPFQDVSSKVYGELGGAAFFSLSAKSAAGGLPVTQFNLPFTVTHGYGSSLPLLEGTLALYWWDGSQWVKEASSTLDNSNNQVKASLDHASTFAVLGETRRVRLPLLFR